MKRHSILLSVLFFLLGSIAGCVCAEPKSGGDIVQIIVKFKDTSTPPASNAMIESLGDSAKLHVRHLRPMSGGAQIYLLSGAASDTALNNAVKQISSRPDVEYAEVDRKLKPEKDQANGAPKN